ncbi:DUF72 domain-containing protein [Candidimonas sp. SYP-B2681]|uniref:DUF72 domain-containing protein n=1 Tax=Candidimonas sp. SYP-B2681 TaxID=2497686 RepID=UPI000F869EB4|nr:DUF72 domain-containing protein [Candidimonas sp. SYP-B2681]RTZ47845.1 DUF72 domain-containing protein [Candidimonas sp. SYP-B2681]
MKENKVSKATFQSVYPTPSSVYIGCAGWSLTSRIAARFPAEGTHLERYAQVFPSVEINSTFYRPHLPKTYARWAASVPDAFRFSVKIPRTISHDRKLRATDDLIRAFMDQLVPLGYKMGCLLLQLPPSLAMNGVEARDFFTTLRGHTNAAVVCEPRHATWFSSEAADLMKDAGVACVHAHPSPVAGIESIAESHMLYLRLHGAPRIYYSAYDDEFIDALAAQILAARRRGRQVWCIFDNTASGQAAPNALTLMERLEKMEPAL